MRPRLLLFGLALVLVAAACGPDTASPAGTTEAPTGTTAEVEPTSTTAEPSPPTTSPDGRITVSHRDLVAARLALDGARTSWADNAPTDYVLSVFASCECEGWRSESVIVDGTAAATFVLPPEPSFEPEVPSDVDAIFHRAELLLSRLEQDPSLAATSDCQGSHLHMEFDGTTGFPLVVGDNTPCDGGVDWYAEYEALDGQDEPDVDLSTYVGIGLFNLEGINPAVDGLVANATSAFPGAVEPARPDVRYTFGMPCRGASDPDGCWAAVEAILADPEAEPVLTTSCPMCVSDQLTMVATDGDDVVLVTPDTLWDVLGDIDTPSEAILVAGVTGSVTPAEHGWDVITARVVVDCDPVVERTALLGVRTNGLVWEIDRWYSVDPNTCI